MPSPHVLFAGRTTVDAVYWLERFPQEDSKVFARQFRAAPGGPACNAAITHALLGGRATLVSAVGSGPWAELARTALARYNIALIDLAEGTDYETPLTTVLVSAAGASRTIVNPPQQDCEWRNAEPGRMASLGEAPSIVLSDGFHLPHTLPLLAACRDRGAALCLDAGSWKPGTQELLPLLTYAIASEHFALPGCAADAEATLAWFAGRGVPHAAVTRGSRPILGLDRGRRFEIAISPAEVVDTLGAGDVLHGAFCSLLAQGGGFEESLRRAAEIATRSCASIGVEDGVRESAGMVRGERPAPD